MMNMIYDIYLKRVKSIFSPLNNCVSLVLAIKLKNQESLTIPFIFGTSVVLMDGFGEIVSKFWNFKIWEHQIEFGIITVSNWKFINYKALYLIEIYNFGLGTFIHASLIGLNNLKILNFKYKNLKQNFVIVNNFKWTGCQLESCWSHRYLQH